jgi:hypothetical protein
LHVEPGSDGVRREIHEGIPADNYRLEGFYKGNDKLYVDQEGTMYDGRGMLVEKTDTGWLEHACSFKKAARTALADGNATSLHDKLLGGDGGGCAETSTAMSAKRAARYEALLASRKLQHGNIPAFDVDPQPAPVKPVADATAADVTADPASADDGEPPPPTDLVTYLADTMTWYIEWPHVDDTFRTVYRTLPGYDVHSADDESE